MEIKSTGQSVTFSGRFLTCFLYKFVSDWTCKRVP